MKPFHRVLTLSFLVGSYVHLSAGVIVNEVKLGGRGNPPAVTWVELYNNSDSLVALEGKSIVSGRTVVQLTGIMMQSHSYLVICDQKYGPDSFENEWGDNSGFWGDRSFESTFGLRELPIAAFGESESVVLKSYDGTQLSVLYCSSDTIVRSWERSSLSSDTAIHCLFGAGGTPGEANSLVGVARDLSIESVIVRSVWPSCQIAIAIKNVGMSLSPPTNLVLTRKSISDHDTIAAETIPALSSGAAYTVTTNISFEGVWQPVTALLHDDERLTNSHKFFVVVGDDYPPLILSEIMAAPLPNRGGEWIEIMRRSDTAVNLQGWSLRDDSRQVLLSDTLLLLNDSIAVLIQSEGEFIAEYGYVNVPLIHPVSWATLNNNGDNIRLVDPYGIEADGCKYDAIPDDGKTLARSAKSGLSGIWLISADSNGTPGSPNRVIEESLSDPILTVLPQTITPDGDDRNDEATFSVTIPSRSQCTIRIFDRNGRVVRTLLSNQTLPSNEVHWDGRDMNGERLPIGIYVALLEVSDGTSVRKAVVLAR